MGWDPGDYTVAFQSRFGPEKWIGPSTAEVLEGLHARNIRRPLVVAPGFTTDCLETLDELGNEGRDEFVKGGGTRSDYALCPCLNDHETWIQTMVELVRGAPRQNHDNRLNTVRKSTYGVPVQRRPSAVRDRRVARVGRRLATCVREIAFVDSRAAVPSGATILHDEDAYAHLLEVICGLDSPMVGETEVLHQFKVFAANIRR